MNYGIYAYAGVFECKCTFEQKNWPIKIKISNARPVDELSYWPCHDDSNINMLLFLLSLLYDCSFLTLTTRYQLNALIWDLGKHCMPLLIWRCVLRLMAQQVWKKRRRRFTWASSSRLVVIVQHQQQQQQQASPWMLPIDFSSVFLTQNDSLFKNDKS